MHLKEVKALEPIHTTTQVLAADDKRLHVFQTIFHTPSGDVLATGEQMLLHVDTKARSARPPAEPARARQGCSDLRGRTHANLPNAPTRLPAAHVGQKR